MRSKKYFFIRNENVILKLVYATTSLEEIEFCLKSHVTRHLSFNDKTLVTREHWCIRNNNKRNYLDLIAGYSSSFGILSQIYSQCSLDSNLVNATKQEIQVLRWHLTGFGFKIDRRKATFLINLIRNWKNSRYETSYIKFVLNSSIFRKVFFSFFFYSLSDGLNDKNKAIKFVDYLNSGSCILIVDSRPISVNFCRQ